MGVSVLDLRLTGWREVTLGSGQRATTRTLIGQRVSSGFGQGALALFAPYFSRAPKTTRKDGRSCRQQGNGWLRLWQPNIAAGVATAKGRPSVGEWIRGDRSKEGSVASIHCGLRGDISRRAECLNTMWIERWQLKGGARHWGSDVKEASRSNWVDLWSPLGWTLRGWSPVGRVNLGSKWWTMCPLRLDVGRGIFK